jgi:hypothetical protein
LLYLVFNNANSIQPLYQSKVETSLVKDYHRHLGCSVASTVETFLANNYHRGLRCFISILESVASSHYQKGYEYTGVRRGH